MIITNITVELIFCTSHEHLCTFSFDLNLNLIFKNR